ncbi:hypothetical protein QFC19_007478 [Naganishia cerealis]|uniref:Uncharacterized protein n=1 Tax=Naganishia cerealis TaxID=610337 RepID=A0ACC2V9I8_9TREE|nr:hypothetical protein QFC19_007478 [Naganishia cerealis]
MSSNQTIPSSGGKKPPFSSSSPYGITPPTVPNIPPRTSTGSPANNARGSIVEGGGGQYIAAATSFRPKSFNPRAAATSSGGGSFFSANSHGEGRNSGDHPAITGDGTASVIGEKRQLLPGTIASGGGEPGTIVGKESALSKALERERVAKSTTTTTTTTTKDDASNVSIPPLQSDIPRIPTPGTEHPPSSDVPTPPVQAPDISEIPEEEKLRILRRHLVSADERQGSTPSPTAGVESPGGDSRRASIHHAGGSTFSIAGQGQGQGGAGGSGVSRVSGTRTPDHGPGGASGFARSIRDDASAAGDAENGGGAGETFPIPYDAPGGDVTASFSAPPLAQRRNASLDPSLAHMHEPGGFRRQFVINSARERGEAAPRVLKSFVDFLYLYGHFAGEDLDEDEEDEDDDTLPAAHSYTSPARGITGEEAEAVRRGLSRGPSALPQHMVSERSQLMGDRVGTLSRANSKTRAGRRAPGEKGDASVVQALLMPPPPPPGILFSTIVMLLIAAISLWSFLLLVKTRLVVPGSFGERNTRLTLPPPRGAAYTIFVAENLQAFVLAVSNCKTFIATKWLIAAQLVIVLPLSMIRNLAALSSTALIADAFILVGQAMKEPQKFPRVLTGCMVFVALLFTGFGVMGYMAYGSDIQTVVIVNLPQDDKFVQAVQFLYTVAIILSLPLQLFPAVRIMENGLFTKSGKHNPQVKWQKNTFRAMTVLGCSLISWAGASNLDGFVSFIGSFACVPLCFIYPPLLHLRARARTRTQRALDYGLIAFGVITTVYTSVQTILVLARPAPKEGTEFGKCQPSKT